MIITILGSVALGLAIGMMSGLIGVGGGVIMVPMFRLLFGMAPTASTATSLFTIIPTSVSGAVTHIRGKTSLPKLGIALGVGGACTSPIGVYLAELSPGWLVMMAAALAIGYSASTMLRKALKAPKPSEEPQAAVQAGKDGASEQPAQANSDMPEINARLLMKAALIGVAAGLVSGYVGLGGGFIMIPLMVSFLNLPMRIASGTSLVAVMILALPATIVQCVLGNVDFMAGIAVACGSIPGAVVGARLVNRVPERSLRLAFAAFLGIAAILLVANEVGLMV